MLCRMRGEHDVLAACMAASLLLHALWVLSASRPPTREGSSAESIELTIEISQRAPQDVRSEPNPAAEPPRSARRQSAATNSVAERELPPKPIDEIRERRAGAQHNATPADGAVAILERPAAPPNARTTLPTDAERGGASPSLELTPQAPTRDTRSSLPAADDRRTASSSHDVAPPAAATDDRSSLRAADDRRAASSSLALTPRAAASALDVAVPPDRGRLCNPRARTAGEHCEDELSLPPAQGVQDELNRSLRAAAQVHDYLAKREPPALKRASDGSYSFSGLVFQARIEPDGHVNFSDEPVVRTGPIPIAGRFDIGDAVEKYLLGKEIYSAEKHWFLDQTAELRERLSRAARASERSQAKREVERELERILGGAQSPSQKRAAVFALWEDCGDDADSAAVRRVVEAFIRARMPQDSPLGYSASELQERNRTRPTSFRFDPYDSS